MQHDKTRTSWQLFNKIASTYDSINRILSFGRDQKWRRSLATHLPLKKNLQILDLATGTADQLIALFESKMIHDKQSIQTIVGIDLAKEMLEIAKKKVNQKPYKDKVQFIEASIEKIPFKDHTFDAVTLSFGIRNVPHPIIALQEIHRVLKPDGRCLILEFSLPPWPFQSIHRFYLRKILPHIGGTLSKSKEAYRYLNETIESFPSGNAFAFLLKQTMFHKIQMHPMAFGAVTLYVGTKS